MGKKTKKTKWRTLEIPPLSGKNFENANNLKWDDERRTLRTNYHQYDKSTRQPSSFDVSPLVTTSNLKYSCVKEERKTLEDEYTKITTPRQDVLFKKGYLTRRKAPETISENSLYQNSDDTAQDCTTNEDFINYGVENDNVQQYVCPPHSFIDPSALYYSSGYEIYDPYVTVVVGPSPGQYPTSTSCQPVLTSVPYRPVPLQSVQWFNPFPFSDWCCSYSPQSDKRFSTESENGNSANSESSGVSDNPSKIIEEQLDNSSSVFPPSYVYPGFMFGAPICNVNEVNVQYYTPQSSSPVLSNSEQTVSKRKKKRKRRRRSAGEVEEESESSVDDNFNHSVSNNECILDFQSQPESLSYEDEQKYQTSFTPSIVSFSSLPYEVVNAPEFVPSDLSLSSTTCSGNDNDTATTFICPPHNDENNISQTENLLKKSTGVNVYCKPFGNQQNKPDLERASSSSNSDSGISSPGSEDTSKSDFTKTETEINRSDDIKKMSKSRKSKKVKNKMQEGKSCEELVQIVKKSNQKTSKATSRNESKKVKNIKSEKLKKKKNSCGNDIENNKNKNIDKNEIVTFSKNKLLKKDRSKIAEIYKKQSTENVNEIEQSMVKSQHQHLINKNTSDMLSESNKLKSKLIDNKVDYKVVEKKGTVVNDHTKTLTSNLLCNNSSDYIEGEFCRKSTQNICEIEVNIKNVGYIFNFDNNEYFQTMLNDTYNSMQETANAHDLLSRTVFNEHIIIEKKPLLTKLINLNEFIDNSENILESIFISDFSSCRKNALVRPLRKEEKLCRKNVESTAQQIVDEIIENAERKVLSSVTCDTLQLPITQAVTKWLNEHGGLSAVIEDSLHSSQNDPALFDDNYLSNDEYEENGDKIALNIKVDKAKLKKSKPNCVIC